jgi:simple sugar transport system permease protein
MSARGALAFGGNLLAAGLAQGTPLLYASLGEVLAERAGVLNLGVEGMMLLGAAAGFAAACATSSLAWGIFAAAAAAALLAAVHAGVTVTLAADQVVSGLGLNFFGAGLASVIGARYVGVAGAPRVPSFAVAGLAAIPVVGPALFSQNALVYAGVVAAVAARLYVQRTRWGLMLRAVGESPSAADAQGISVARVRYGHVVAGGALAGLAGASLSLAITPGWVDGMTAGQGWIAVGLVIFANWDPLRAAGGAYLFGALRRLPLDLQGVGSLPFFRNPNLGYFLDLLPYLFTIGVLVLASVEWRRTERGLTRRWMRRAPAGLGLPFVRGERGR